MRSMWTLLILLALTGPALAVEGVLEINQTCAVQTGCFAGDSAGFPGSISASGGWGVLGDSNSDEYRADNGRGGAFGATTFNWLELLVNARGLDFGSWGTRSEPRRTGYAQNWARSSATSRSIISSGQHIGLAAQVASGAVSNVMIWVGFNDFDDDHGEYGRIYSGVLSGQALQAKLDRVVADLTEAVDVLLSAGSPRIVLATLVDTVTASIIASYPNPLLRQRVTDAIDEVNARLIPMANARGIALIDLEVLKAAFLQHVDENGFFEIGGELIDLNGVGNEPHNLTLGDGKHVGTVGSGLSANILILESFNQFYGLGIPLLTDQEILSAAGFAVPEPSAWAMHASALAVIAGLARRASRLRHARHA